jgi:hypothetical protein
VFEQQVSAVEIGIEHLLPARIVGCHQRRNVTGSGVGDHNVERGNVVGRLSDALDIAAAGNIARKNLDLGSLRKSGSRRLEFLEIATHQTDHGTVRRKRSRASQTDTAAASRYQCVLTRQRAAQNPSILFKSSCPQSGPHSSN